VHRIRVVSGKLLDGWVGGWVSSLLLLCFATAEMWGSNLYEAMCVCVCVCFNLFIWTQEILCEKSRSKQTNRARRKEDGLAHLEKKETKELSKRVCVGEREEEVVSGNPTSTPNFNGTVF
jgi:hypothetical protein